MSYISSRGAATEQVVHDFSGADANVEGQDQILSKSLYFEVDWVALTGTPNATAQVQMSTNKINWTNVGSAVSMATADGHDFITDIGDFPAQYFRIVFTKGTTTGGIVTCTSKAV